MRVIQLWPLTDRFQSAGFPRPTLKTLDCEAFVGYFFRYMPGEHRI